MKIVTKYTDLVNRLAEEYINVTAEDVEILKTLRLQGLLQPLTEYWWGNLPDKELVVMDNNADEIINSGEYTDELFENVLKVAQAMTY